MNWHPLLAAGALLLGPTLACPAEVKVVTAHDPGGSTFTFKTVPGPVRGDAAEKGRIKLVDGQPDRNGRRPNVLGDGRVASGEDQPGESFFFRAGTDGGRILVDLGEVRPVREINTYSWHVSTRAPQVYRLYASEGTSNEFDAEPKRGIDPASAGWEFLAKVDTRPPAGEEEGGQHGASIANSEGLLGKFRYLLFDISQTEDRDPFGNTFYSEIDVIDPTMPKATPATEERLRIAKTFTTSKYHFTIEATEAPDLMEWADRELRPVVQEWYPKIVAMLPSEGYEATTNVTLRFRNDMGGTPASAGGGRINMNSGWFRRELQREARGSVVHEMVHVVQNYGRGRRRNPSAVRTPGWLVEGMADYIRWFLYEPETKGAEITARNLSRARYDASYRITGNFLDWVTRRYDKDLVRKLNAAAREGRYSGQLWKDATGHTVEDLGAEWKKAQEDRIKK